jgi:hypothetical protein
MELKEAQLFAPIKAYYKKIGFTVYAEVPNKYRNVDVVCVKGGLQIAIEMKTTLNKDVVYQAWLNKQYFHRSYVATPNIPNFNLRWMQEPWLQAIGILQVKGDEIITHQEAAIQTPLKIYDFTVFEERVDDTAGVPWNKGKSDAKVVLLRIKHYLKAHPQAKWKEIFENIQNHYANQYSLKNSMYKFQGFDLDQYKNEKVL